MGALGGRTQPGPALGHPGRCARAGALSGKSELEKTLNSWHLAQVGGGRGHTLKEGDSGKFYKLNGRTPLPRPVPYLTSS